MVYTTHKNGDDWGVVYGIGLTTLTVLRKVFKNQDNPWERQWYIARFVSEHCFLEHEVSNQRICWCKGGRSHFFVIESLQ